MDKVSIVNAKRTIPAIIMIPKGEGPFPAVVMNHGHGGSKEEHGGFTSLAKAFLNEGIASIRMDFPGCGESEESFIENYISNMVSDSNASLNYLLDNYNIDKERLGILGYSMGGRVALTLVKEGDSPYKSMGLLAPSTDLGEDVAKKFIGGEEAYNSLYEKILEKGYLEFPSEYMKEQILSKEWIKEMENSHPQEDVNKFKGDMLLIYGGEDTVVPIEENKKLLEAFPDMKEIFIKNADHSYGFNGENPPVRKKVEDSFTSFFKQL